MTRRQTNIRILELLESLVNAHPDQRFLQLLVNADVLVTEKPDGWSSTGYRDEYNVESKVILERVRNSKIWEVS